MCCIIAPTYEIICLHWHRYVAREFLLSLLIVCRTHRCTQDRCSYLTVSFKSWKQLKELVYNTYESETLLNY